MMIEGDGKQDGDEEEDEQHRLIMCAHEWQAYKINRQNRKFRRHDVSHNRPDKKSVFAFEEHAARRTVMLDVKRAFND